nr:ATP-binding protein [Tumebacillus amylolyticus]
MRSLSLHGVKGFRKLTIELVDPVNNKVRPRTVIVGKNGSGKTTILDHIFGVIDILSKGEEAILRWNTNAFHVAGIEMALEYPELKEQTPFMIHTGNWYGINQQTIRSDDIYMGEDFSYLDRPRSGKLLVRTERAERLVKEIKYASAGVDSNPDLGNLLYFPTDRLTTFKFSGEIQNEAPQFHWTYRYNRYHNEWKGSVESFLVWLYFRDLKARETNPDATSRFHEFAQLVNRFLEDKTITTVGYDYRVEVVHTISGQKLHLDALSSGENQLILLLGEIYRYIRKGSILLIDEPEIHLHPVWQRLFMETLTALCKKYDAQFIVTTQSPRIAESVVGYEVINLDNLLEESRS